MQGSFVNSDIVFGCDHPTHNPSSVRILSLLSQFSGLTSLQPLVSGETLQGGLIKVGLSFRSDNLTYNPSLFVCFFLCFVFFVFQIPSFQGGFVNLDIVFGCGDPTCNPSSVWKLSLLIQFSGLTTLQPFVVREVLQGEKYWQPHI